MQLSDLALHATPPMADENLKREGVACRQNLPRSATSMIDTLVQFLPQSAEEVFHRPQGEAVARARLRPRDAPSPSRTSTDEAVVPAHAVQSAATSVEPRRSR